MGAPKLSPTSTKWKKRWSHQQTKSPRACGARFTRPLILILNWAPSPPTCRLLSAILYITVQRCPHQQVTRMKCILHSYLFGHFIFVYFVFSLVKFVYFFEIPRKMSMHLLKFHCLLLMPQFLLCSITLLQTTTTHSFVFYFF